MQIPNNNKTYYTDEIAFKIMERILNNYTLIIVVITIYENQAYSFID